MGNEIQKRDNQLPVAAETEGFGTSAITRANETSSTALAAQAKAQVEARYIIALQRPRDWDTVRVKLLKECDRPGFADCARYSKPVGGQKIEGPSIRFAEAAIRCMGNMLPESPVIWEDEQKRIIRVSVTDLESNVTYSTDVIVTKTVERKKLKEGQQALGSRLNSYGDVVYLIPATDDEMANKQNAQISKALRTNGLRHIPGDILDECMDRVIATQNKRDVQDPDAAKKKLLDAFAKLGVMPTQLAEYLGHATDSLAPAELLDLRAVYAAINEGEATWLAVMATKKPAGDESNPEAEKTQRAVEKVKDRLKSKEHPPKVIDAKQSEPPPPMTQEEADEDERQRALFEQQQQATRGKR